jgi:transcriptional regulator GlxA family with amidase domain
MMVQLPVYAFPPATSIPSLSEAERRRRLVLVVSPTQDPLEIIGPLNALRTGNFVLEFSGRPDMGYDIEIVASLPGCVFRHDGLTISVDRTYDQIEGNVDTLLLAPMDFDLLLEGQEKFLTWVRRMSMQARRTVTVCSGAYILAEAGILKDRRATTHWDLEPDFTERYPDVQLDVDSIYIKDGRIYTSAGMTAGLDLMIALVEEDFGRNVALRVAQAMVLFLKRPGSQSQFSTQLSHDLSETSEIAELQSYIYENIDEDLRVERLAERVNMSPRNFSRTFTKEIGVAPGRFVEQCRLEIARQRLETSEQAISKVAEGCGYGSTDSMRLAFERQLGVSPRDYRRRFATANREQVAAE